MSLRNFYGRAALAAAACLCACSLLTGCSGSDKVWEDIEPAAEGEFGEPKYEDGMYLTQEVRDPAPDPYADDTEKQSEGITDDGICYAVYERHAEITGHTEDFDAADLTVPKEIEGKPVSRIASVAVSEDNRFMLDEAGGFYGCYSLNRVTLPDTLTEIGAYAFYGCKNLRKVTVPESVTVIGARAFSMCRNLEEFAVPTGIGFIGDSAFAQTPWYDNLLFHRDLVIFNGMLYDAGHRCTGDVTIPDYVVTVCDYAFYDSAELKSVTIPESVKSVGKCAFCACSSLSTIVFENPECEIFDDPSTVCNRNVENEYRFNGTVRGDDGSTAEKYAKKYGYRFSSDLNAPKETIPEETTAAPDETTGDETETTAAAEEE